ncbi:MAG TPA: NAD(+)/NADH kinase [Thermoleophilaceae bacterium]|nr:NAD(+)/NADH kinase [Thermoleophilaceae bacterium]
MKRPERITLFTHQYPEETSDSVQRVIEMTRAAGVEVLVPPPEAEKHSLGADSEGVRAGAETSEPTDLALVLGGDGTILTALRTYAGRGVPVFALNFGAIGFLATVERRAFDDGLRDALAGNFELLELPGIAIEVDGEDRWAVNDVSIHRRPTHRVAELGYSIRDDTLGQVRCDGLVASTPVGSTGYNLANGGPILAWGVEGYVVSFIAPHTLTARTLVVAPNDTLTVENLSRREDVEVTTDGRPTCALAPGEQTTVRFQHDRFLLAQMPGTSFYHRFREKFGRLAY